MSSANHYACTVSVETEFNPEQSDIAHNRYAFKYHIKITNTGTIATQLISRHWIITDASGAQHEVKGLGVVGAQPLLGPSESFEYTSGTLIGAPTGEMRGTYQMVAEDGIRFEAVIHVFSLNMPRVLH